MPSGRATTGDRWRSPFIRLNPQAAERRLGAVREIEWRSSRDGRPVFGVPVAPPGYRLGTPIKR